METLMDLYKSVESPLDDIDIIKKCIELYSETQKSGKSFYRELVEINSNEKENSGMYRGFDEEVLDNWRMSTFKDNIVNMTPEKYASLFGSEDGYYSEEFKLLKDFFLMKMVLNFGILENLCLFCNMRNGKILKRLLIKQ